MNFGEFSSLKNIQEKSSEVSQTREDKTAIPSKTDGSLHPLYIKPYSTVFNYPKMKLYDSPLASQRDSLMNL
jgi:hypothetical protein